MSKVKGAEPASASNVLPEAAGEISVSEQIFQHSILGSDYDQIRQRFLDAGVSLRAVTVQDVQGALGDARRGSAVAGETTVFLDLDGQRLIGWNNARLHASGTYIGGPQLSSQFVGNYMTSSSVAGPNGLRLTELWVEQSFLNARISVRIGQLAAHDEFMLQDPYFNLVNNTFSSLQIKTNLNTPSTPIGQPGARIRVEPSSNTYLKVGAYNGRMDPVRTDPSGTAFSLNGNPVLATEVGYTINGAAGSPGLAGDYKVGLIREFGAVTRYGSSVDSAQREFGNEIGYVILTQELWRRHDNAPASSRPGIVGVLAFAATPYPDRSVAVRQYIAQLRWIGILPGRDEDSFGVGAACADLSSAYIKAQRQNQKSAGRVETLFEISYHYAVFPGLVLQPDLQLVARPMGISSRPVAVVPGLRLLVTF